MQAALGHAKASGAKVQLTCSYMQHYVSKHREHQPLLVAASEQGDLQ